MHEEVQMPSKEQSSGEGGTDHSKSNGGARSCRWHRREEDMQAVLHELLFQVRELLFQVYLKHELLVQVYDVCVHTLYLVISRCIPSYSCTRSELSLSRTINPTFINT